MTSRTALVATLVAALMLTACGRRGDPLTPHESAVKQAKENEQPAPEKPENNRPFILDGLLQ
ncbi:lipoprotein [Pseudahrensia aquimaris]|uniref:Lipoprotein n=1 Tax=Pseudahrensia aquimaris TaxID=744461 RepID=A0ABW3F9H6_9HYPH